MKNKKAIKFFGEHIVNLVFAILAVIVLIYLGSKAYGMFFNDTDSEKAEKTLNSITEAVNFVIDEDSSGSSKLTIYPPENWYLISDKESEINHKECLKESCLCVCGSYGCNSGLMICKGFDFEVVVEGDISLTQRSSQSTEYYLGLQFEEAIEELLIVLGDKDKVIIRRNE